MSAQFDSIIRNGTVVLAEAGPAKLDLAISAGRIAAILQPGSKVEAHEHIDADGLTVFPGVIDVHLHLGHGNDISRPRVASDAESETGSAASGGVTTIIPYLLTPEPFENGLFEDVRAVTQAGSYVDFGYHFIIATEDQLAAVPRYVSEYGVPSFKIFMNNRGGEGKRLGLPDIDDGFLYRLAKAAVEAGGMVCPHPENIEVSWTLRDKVMLEDPEGKGGLKSWNATRPPFVEADAVQRAAVMTQQVGGKLYIVHTSSKAALDAGVRMREAGVNITLETCPHYLTHSVDWSGGVIGKINPPLREQQDCDALWEAVADGRIDTVATDHVHRTMSAKDGGIWKASPGCPGMETLLPIMISEGYHKRGLPLARIAQLLSVNPARAMGLTDKGGIAIGKDADLAIVDLDAGWTVRNGDVRSDAGYSIYDGWTLKGKVTQTILRGMTVYKDGELDRTRLGSGRYVRRSLQK